MTLILISLSLADDSADLAKSCMDRYHSQAAIAACMSEPRFQSIEAAQAKINARLDEVQARDREILESLAKLSDSVAKLTREQTVPSSTPSAAPVHSAVQAPVAPARTTLAVVGGASYQGIARPSLVSIYPIPGEADTLHVTALGEQAAYRRCGGTSKSRVLVTNHGIPISIWAPPGVPSGFIEIYADLDGDGASDATAYKVLDPTQQSDFVVTYRAGDDLGVIFLRDSGKVLEIPGFPLQTLWRKPTKRDNASTGVINCSLDPLEGYGGKRTIAARSLSPRMR
ncbi:hypothetical protein HZA87_05165 [Candidatus Uhrbacteria bacterium]|nr:hypothetical protein [Candidatus Uhrbacteria bacterium]